MDLDRWDFLTPAQQEAILDGPAAKPPSGTESNISNPPNRHATVIGVVAMCVFLATTMVLLRIYSKVFVSKKIKPEDVLGLIAFGPYLGEVWGILYSAQLDAFFVHQWDMTFRVFLEVLYPYFLIPNFYAFTMLFAKTAILLEWMRIFVPKGTRNFFFWACSTVLIINIIFYVAGIFIINLTCRPVRKSWWPMTPGECLDLTSRRRFDFSSACINLVLDLMILLLPQHSLWKLNMARKKKKEISLIFSVGVMACAAAVGRVVTGLRLTRSSDRTYDAAGPALCSLAEMTCVFLVFCSTAVPRVFSQTSTITRIAQTLRSWSRIRSRNRSAASDPAVGNDHINSGTYRKMHENAELPLARLSRPGEGDSTRQPVNTDSSLNQPRSKHDIVRTTMLKTQDDQASDFTRAEQHRRQHPWI